MMLKKPKNVSHFTINYMLNRLLFISIVLLFFSCGNEKALQLPEIQNADITEVLDVSPAYIFYDETKQDSVELNRKNLIISTNWLINVDKRLTLEQALPSIIKLQEKKRNATMHKNEKARNYYTCNDTSIKNLGFIDFTDVAYFSKKEESKRTNDTSMYIEIKVHSQDSVKIDITSSKFSNIIKSSYAKLIFDLESILAPHGENFLSLSFKHNLIFQDYIEFKSILNNLTDYNKTNLSISNNEFIY